MTVRRSRAYLGLGANLGDAEATLAWSIGGLMDRLDELPHATPITVLCKSGARASIAASLLDAAGCEVRLVSRGGVPGVPDVLAAVPAARAAQAVG